jgi:outer membrane receptor protein involved in Fe transport
MPGDINTAVLNAALADPNPATAFNPFGDGSHTNPATLAAIQKPDRFNITSKTSSIQLTGDGPLLDLPSGSIKAAVGVEYGKESLFSAVAFDQTSSRRQYGRNVAAAFSELSVPVVGDAAYPHGASRLELSLAGRYEHYSDFGQTFNPKIGLRWTPLTSIKLRTSWSTSFKAPNLIDLSEKNNASTLVSLNDPRSPTGHSNALGLQGGNSHLKQESATTWTAGLDLAPPVLPGLQLSLTGYSIDYKDQVIQPGPPNASDILSQEGRWAAVITRNPSQSQIDAICRR